MRVIEKYLTMSVADQEIDIMANKFVGYMFGSKGHEMVLEMLNYLNSEIQDPLEKLGYEKISEVIWKKGDGRIKIDEERFETYFPGFYDDITTPRPVYKSELKAILEIMEVTK